MLKSVDINDINSSFSIMYRTNSPNSEEETINIEINKQSINI